MASFRCQSYGGEIITEATTAATHCPYCGSPVVLTGRVSGTLRPDCVIPFKVTEADAKKAMKAFADTVEALVTEARTDRPYASDHKYHAWSSVCVGLFISLGAGLAAAAGVTHAKKTSYTGFVRSQAQAGDYMTDMRLTGQADEYLYNKVHRTKRVTTSSSSSSSGRSSYHLSGSHTSSSGRSHGGGGGKF